MKSRRRADGTARPQQPQPRSATAPPQAVSAAQRSSPPRRKPQAEPDEGYVAVGRVLSPFGLKGEVRLQPLTDNAERFLPKSRVWAGTQPLTIEAAREAQGYVYLSFKGFHDRSSVEPFTHALLQVPESALAPLEEGIYYRFQLIGLAVVSPSDEILGTLDEIIETGANDVYRVRRPDGSDMLLPALPDVILNVDLDAKQMVADPPEWR